MRHFDRNGQRAWQRNEQHRAQVERRDHEDRRRQRAGLAPRPTPSAGPVDFSGIFVDGNRQVVNDTTYRYFADEIGYRSNASLNSAFMNYGRNRGTGQTWMGVDLAADGSERSVEHPIVREEPTLREVWAD